MSLQECLTWYCCWDWMTVKNVVRLVWDRVLALHLIDTLNVVLVAVNTRSMMIWLDLQAQNAKLVDFLHQTMTDEFVLTVHLCAPPFEPLFCSFNVMEMDEWTQWIFQKKKQKK